jgi:hypothetical protein
VEKVFAMNIRLSKKEVRFRLTQGELRSLSDSSSGSIDEKVLFPGGVELTFSVVKDPTCEVPRFHSDGRHFVISLSPRIWTGADIEICTEGASRVALEVDSFSDERRARRDERGEKIEG